MTYRRIILLFSCAAFVQILPTRAQDESGALLAQAYDSLSRADYVAAEQISRTYLASYPANYKIAFIHAVSLCNTSRGSDQAQRELFALEEDYALSDTALEQVNGQLDFCRAEAKSAASATAANNTDVGVSSQGLSGPPPGVDSAGPTQPQPNRFRDMGSLVSATSYSGDDYYHYSAKTPQQCSNTCRIQAPCRSMTYDLYAHVCWLKRSVPPARHGDNFVSAIKLGR
jgi:hypothetical protein